LVQAVEEDRVGQIPELQVLFVGLGVALPSHFEQPRVPGPRRLPWMSG
jgi:hypothetical protein